MHVPIYTYVLSSLIIYIISSISTSVSISYVQIYIYISISLIIYLFTYLSIYLSIYLSSWSYVWFPLFHLVSTCFSFLSVSKQSLQLIVSNFASFCLWHFIIGSFGSLKQEILCACERHCPLNIHLAFKQSRRKHVFYGFPIAGLPIAWHCALDPQFNDCIHLPKRTTTLLSASQEIPRSRERRT